LLIVILHVIPPAIFALIHGGILYRMKGISIFVAFCLGFGSLAEGVSLRTGFPFGHYYFTDAMGPKVLQVPVLLVLAYLGIAYVSWVLALLILGYLDKPINGVRTFALPLLASFIMVAWDLSMDPDWSTLDHVWVWQHGGAYFGVPLSNFFGWFLTAYLYYLAFALYCRTQPIFTASLTKGYWRTAILFYATCALGNLLILRLPMAPPVVTDATGKPWLTGDILGGCMLMSLLLMVPFALLAWLRLMEKSQGSRNPVFGRQPA
jgi:putative membrane protein